MITYKNNANAVNLVTGALISSQNSQIMMNVLNNLVYLHNTSSFNTKVYSIDKFEQIINAKFESTGINALCEYQATASLRYNVCNTGVVSVPTSNSIIYGKDGVIAEFSKPSGTQGSSVGATDGKLFFLPLNNNKLGVYASDAEKIAEFDYDFGSSLTTTKVISGKDVILVLTGTQNAHFLYDKTLKTLTPIVLNPVYTLMGDDKNGYEILDSEGNSHYYNLGDKELSQRARGKPEVFVKIDGVEIS
ncbi:hypothetical protein [Campylobacter fetus]|uniref:hypothetical protein n=1 Tax=Campylobacter fetus TaxID=196 RepID=UPI0026E0EFAB|nr:hypothetical protein [Campylobacter fetus]WKW19896.1 hypothetical protein IXZ14_05815 [Campylobacter fetus subsp. venerealis]WKW23579.1 hypothetical protein IXZ22_04040 [Campylobacter fetus subsp. venerealis]WKW23662.1 hypothetical protein IXZ22_04510 [Campylobacter fetus subsp. venerealis]